MRTCRHVVVHGTISVNSDCMTEQSAPQNSNFARLDWLRLVIDLELSLNRGELMSKHFHRKFTLARAVSEFDDLCKTTNNQQMTTDNVVSC